MFRGVGYVTDLRRGSESVSPEGEFLGARPRPLSSALLREWAGPGRGGSLSSVVTASVCSSTALQPSAWPRRRLRWVTGGAVAGRG